MTAGVTAPSLEPMSSRLARSAGLIGIATMASRLLGVVREMVLARLFGASATPAMDAFNVAFRVPNLVRDLFAEGAMTAAFVPTFTRTLQTRGREAAWRLGNLVINALLVVTGVSSCSASCSPSRSPAIASGHLDDALRLLGFDAPTAAAGFARRGKLELTTQLTRIMMPFLTTVAVAVAMMGMLNALHRFFLPALSPAMFNVVTILGAFLLVPLMPPLGLPPIAGIAIGTVLGGIGQIAVQWPALRKEGFRYRPILDFRDPDVREILRLMGPAHARSRRRPDQRARQHLARDDRAAGRRVVAAVRVPPDVSADRALRRLDRDRGAAGPVEARRRPTIATAMRRTISTAPADDADAERAGDDWTDRAGAADRRVAARVRPFTPHDTAATAAALMFYAPGCSATPRSRSPRRASTRWATAARRRSSAS